jgi:hypothetical protein
MNRERTNRGEEPNVKDEWEARILIDDSATYEDGSTDGDDMVNVMIFPSSTMQFLCRFCQQRSFLSSMQT